MFFFVFFLFFFEVKNLNFVLKKCFHPGSNRGPCACEAHVITATPWKLVVIDC